MTEQWAPQINLGVPVLIPEDYVPDLDVRLGCIAGCQRLGDQRWSWKVLPLN